MRIKIKQFIEIFFIVAFFILVLITIFDSYSPFKESQNPKNTDITEIMETIDEIKENQESLNLELDKLIYELKKTTGRLNVDHVTKGSSRISQNIVDIPNRGYEFIHPLNMDIRGLSYVTAYELDSLFKGTNMEGLGRVIIEAELRYSVNAMVIAAIAIHESSYGSSEIARTKNNLFGIQAYDRSPQESARYFSNKKECILEFTQFLSEDYLTEGGKFFQGGYTLKDVNKVYASDKSWSNKVARLVLILDNKIIQEEI